jgi:hypothetical protein
MAMTIEIAPHAAARQSPPDTRYCPMIGGVVQGTATNGL